MRKMFRMLTSGALVALLIGAFWGGTAHAGCATSPDPCEISSGSYHIELPAGDPTSPRPALMMLHGWGADGRAMLGMSGLVEQALARGYAVIAPDGTPREGRGGRSWSFHPDRPGPRDEAVFLEAVRDDAARRHDVDPDRVLLAGFSIGGSMTSYIACVTPDAFAAYAPVAGAFWHPFPQSCNGPVELLHTHGWSDGVVPLEGRILGQTELLDAADIVAQGDVWQAMQVWRAANGCRSNASGHGQDGIFWRRDWRDCDAGRLDFALFPGGHSVPEGWTDMALDWFEAGAR